MDLLGKKLPLRSELTLSTDSIQSSLWQSKKRCHAADVLCWPVKQTKSTAEMQPLQGKSSIAAKFLASWLEMTSTPWWKSTNASDRNRYLINDRFRRQSGPSRLWTDCPKADIAYRLPPMLAVDSEALVRLADVPDGLRPGHACRRCQRFASLDR